MKIRICDGCCSRMIRELDVLQAPLLTRYKEKGRAYMEIRDSVEQKNPSHRWKYLGREILTDANLGAEEDVICYIVEDVKDPDVSCSSDDMSGGWGGHSDAVMSAHDESPEYGGARN